VIFRKRSLPPDLADALESFHAVLGVLEPAKATLTEVIPGSRVPGRPADEAVRVFAEGLRRAQPRMPAWRRPALEAEWQACEQGVGRSIELADGFLDGGRTPVGFEGLLGLVGGLLDPLEPFADAERRFGELRRHA